MPKVIYWQIYLLPEPECKWLYLGQKVSDNSGDPLWFIQQASLKTLWFDQIHLAVLKFNIQPFLILELKSFVKTGIFP